MLNLKHSYLVFLAIAVFFFGFALLAIINKSNNLENMPIDENIPISAGNSNIEASEFQEISIKALGTGFYDKSKVVVKAGIPVRLLFSAEPSAGCGRQLIIDKFGINLVSRNGETVVATFMPSAPGKYAYRCAMNMFRGTLVVE